MMKSISIFGREPAAFLGLLTAVVAVLVGAHVPGLTPVQGAAVVALAGTALLAYTTRPLGPAVLTAVVVAGVALLGTYGVHASEGLVQGLIALTVAVSALFGVRDQVTPQDTHLLSHS